MEMNQSDDEVLLEDLLVGNDRLLTSGQVAEILNVNANTLYLWRTSPEVNLPYQRFVAPGQSRGMIRYKYSDVIKFIGEARQRAVEDLENVTPAGSQRRTIVLEISDDEEIQEFEDNLSKSLAKQRIKQRAKNKAKKNALKDLPLENLIKFKPEFVEEVAEVEVVEEAKPSLVTTSDNEEIQRKAADALREMMESFNRE